MGNQKGFTLLGIIFIVLIASGLALIIVNSLNRENNLYNTSPKDVKAESAKPNIVVIVTDDQDYASLARMTKVNQLIAGQGTNFTKAYHTSDLCCPFRASFLTGQYPHNTGIWSNTTPEGGYSVFDHSNTLPIWLQNAGYVTGHVGRYINEYYLDAVPNIPPGWNEWFTAYDILPHDPFTYTINENGTNVSYVDDELTDLTYGTDHIANKSVDFINRNAVASGGFYLQIDMFSPHEDDTPNGGPEPARRHTNEYLTEPLPTPPSFDEADVKDKPSYIKNLPRINGQQKANLEERYRDRLRSLLAVDEAVEQIVNALSANAILDNTYIVFTSDNGYFLGEHRINAGKKWAYEEGIKAPLVIKGPGIPVQIIDKYVIDVDLTSTIVEWAGATAGKLADGKSVIPLYSDPSITWRNGFLIDGPNRTYRAIRGTTSTGIPGISIEYDTLEKETYNLSTDPYQLKATKSIPSTSQALLNQLKTCAGTSGPTSCWVVGSIAQ